MQKKNLTTFSLVMLITGAVDSIRNLPAASLFGSTLIFFFIFSAIVFLIPTALVSAELAGRTHGNSGVYEWINKAFGQKTAFLAIWLQWITNLVWFPTILSFVVGLITDLINPNLIQNKFYLISSILVIFWFLTLINLRGLHVSAKFASFCAMIGMVIPLTLIISLAIIWIAFGHPLQISLTLSNIVPNFNHVNTWVSLTAIMTAFAGMELSAVHIKDIHHPQKTFPKALHISVWIILITMILGSLAIAIVLPVKQINLVNGVMQALHAFFAVYHIEFLIPFIAVMIFIGTMGGIISWVISPAKGLLHAAKTGFLPTLLSKENEHGVAQNLLITQAIIVSIVCLAFLCMPSVSSSYWLLTALSTQLYMVMYIILFAAALRIRYKFFDEPSSFMIPCGKFGLWFICLLGFIGCFLTITVGFFPPTDLKVGSLFNYELIFICGMFGMIFPILFFYWYKAKYFIKFQ